MLQISVMEQKTSAYLDMLRESDEISSVNYAIEIVRLWAAGYDAVHPAAEGQTNAHTVGVMFDDEVRKRTAFDAGYHGDIHFPVYLGAVAQPVEQVFGHGIYRGVEGKGDSQSGRVRAIEQIIATEVGAPDTDPLAQTYRTFAGQIIAAHTIYRYLDRRIAKRYKDFEANQASFYVAPGKEALYWQAAIYGAPKSPGIYETQGALSHLMQSIMDTATELYGEEADQYLDAWWATVNILRSRRDTFKQAFGEPMQALLGRDLSEARYLLKQRLYDHKETLPYRSRAKFELDDDETDYFEELFSEETAKRQAAVVREPEYIPTLTRAEMLEQARRFIGTLITWVTIKGLTKTAYVRELGLDKRRIPEHSVADPEGPYTEIPFALILDYFTSPEGGRISRKRGSSNGLIVNRMLIETLARLLAQDKLQLLDEGDQYRDRTVDSFELPT